MVYLNIIVTEEILNCLKKVSNQVMLPQDINFYKDNGNVVIELPPKAAALIPKNNNNQFCNMQEDVACFEGWAIATKTYYLSGDAKVVLKIKDDAIEYYDNIDIDKSNKEHLGRFLYRAIRFNEQYGAWFELSDQLKIVCDDFCSQYINNSNICLVNNIPNNVAGEKGGECYVERLLSLNKTLNNVIGISNKYSPYRQLPVGLFVDDVAQKNSIFTGGKSAIDLWVFDDDNNELNIVELKFANKMLGIITEVFFYSNYIYDFIIRKNCSFKLTACPQNKDKNLLRGYNELINIKDRCSKIVGIMLNDKDTGYHPLVNKNTLKVLKDNENMNGQLVYDMKEYELSIK